jgi:hypothetical protein
MNYCLLLLLLIMLILVPGCSAVQTSHPASTSTLSNTVTVTLSTNTSTSTHIPNIFYVAKDGSDSNPGTEEKPWLTIQKAADTMVAGDTVFVKNGTYNENIYIGKNDPRKSGKMNNPITYIAFPGHHPIIDGKELNEPEGLGLLSILGESYITIDGFEITGNSAYYGVYVQGNCSHITLKNLIVHDHKLSGIYTTGYRFKFTDLVIDNCEIYNTNKILESSECIVLETIDGFEVKNCYIHDQGKDGIDAKVGSKNGTIHDNIIKGDGKSWGNYTSDKNGYLQNSTSTGIYLDCYGVPINNIAVYNNYIYDCFAAGIAIASEVSPYPSATGIEIYNNISFNNNFGFAVWGMPFERSFKVINNTFYDNWESGIAIYGLKGTNTNCYVSNNIIIGFGSSDTLIYDPGYVKNGTVTIDHNLFYSPSGEYNYDFASVSGGNIIGDPLLVNPPFDFHLQDNSPAIDKGSPVNSPDSDFAGKIRPSGNSIDIGAYEFAGVSINQPSIQSTIEMTE